ncbi:MAG: hypothetical protein KY461_15465 [Actinobacteria bacterium]|nr:hypothetical protein [Actinomycetota bacterium]
MQEFDPHRETDASVDHRSGHEPFEDWPTRGLTDPIGEIQGYGRLARATNNAGPGWRRNVGRTLAVVLLVTLLVAIVLGAAPTLLG